MNHSVQEYKRIDGLLDELISHSETLVGGGQSSFTSAWSALLNERSRISRSLAEAAQKNPLTPAQTAKLKSAIDVGAKIRFPIAANGRTCALSSPSCATPSEPSEHSNHSAEQTAAAST